MPPGSGAGGSGPRFASASAAIAYSSRIGSGVAAGFRRRDLGASALCSLSLMCEKRLALAMYLCQVRVLPAPALEHGAEVVALALLRGQELL